ncbi:MAG: Cof-type HAD-IIB family hydrolase [Clostridia bacterium]
MTIGSVDKTLKMLYHMIMKYKAIFCDFDGTLYRDDYTVSEKNITAIKEYIARGGRFVISTGRLFSSILPHLQKFGLVGEVIVSQGAGIYDIASGNKIWDKTFEPDQAIECALFAETFDNVVPMAYIGEDCFASEPSDIVDKFANICRIPINFTHCPMSEYFKKISACPSKVLVLMSEDFAETFVKKGSNKFGDNYYLCRSQKFLVELLKAGVNKGLAVEFLCNRYNIDIDDVICVGDSENDISMIKLAGKGIAVGNAFDDVKAAADCVMQETNDEDAVAAIINRYCYD